MPSKPENKIRNQNRWKAHCSTGEQINELLTIEEVQAISVVRESFGLDICKSFRFWERMIARIVDGHETSHKCSWDVEIHYGETVIKIEVKSSSEFICKFDTGSRPVFKFALPKGDKKQKEAEVIVLIGMDADDDVYAWVAAASEIRQSKSITLTSPSHRAIYAKRHYSLDQYSCPPSQLLPEILNAWRRHYNYDHPMHMFNSARTRRSKEPTPDMVDAIDGRMG